MPKTGAGSQKTTVELAFCVSKTRRSEQAAGSTHPTKHNYTLATTKHLATYLLRQHDQAQ